MLLLAIPGCSHEVRTISGQVVDESGSAVSGVALKACYSDWGWSNGRLVWDKDFCSEPVTSDKDGHYRIRFRGPAESRLLLRKEGWLQTTDYHATDTRIVIVRSDLYNARRLQEQQARDEAFRKRRPDETAAAYYCRVIVPETRPVNLTYRDSKLAITPVLLTTDDGASNLLAIEGPPETVRSIAAELQLRADGASITNGGNLLNGTIGCASDYSFIAFSLTHRPAPDTRLEILVPSISALFDADLWRR